MRPLNTDDCLIGVTAWVGLIGLSNTQKTSYSSNENLHISMLIHSLGIYQYQRSMERWYNISILSNTNWSTTILLLNKAGLNINDTNVPLIVINLFSRCIQSCIMLYIVIDYTGWIMSKINDKRQNTR